MSAAVPSPAAVASLHVHPVKSMAGVEVRQWQVEDRGLVGDRRWGVVTPEGFKVTAREVKDLLGLRAEPGDGAVTITDRTGASITVEEPWDGRLVPVSHSNQGEARDAADEAAQWLSERIAETVRLVWQDEDAFRPVRPDLGGESGDRLSLADAGPILLTSVESLAALNDWVRAADPDAVPLAMARFRPNVVVSGAAAFAEDGWERVVIGAVTWRRTMLCDRCGMTLVDPVTLARGREPIETLSRRRAWEGQTWFGVRYAPELSTDLAAISVGDPVVPVTG